MKKIVILLFLIVLSWNAHAQQVGYKGFIEAHYSFGTGEYATNQFVVTTSHGVKLLDNHLFLGGGIGFGVSTEIDELKVFNLPLFADLRYSFLYGKVRPFAASKIGFAYLFDENHDGGHYHDGGFFVFPSIGAAFSVLKHSELTVSLGYAYHPATVEWWNYPPSSQSHIRKGYNAGGILISVGLSF